MDRLQSKSGYNFFIVLGKYITFFKKEEEEKTFVDTTDRNKTHRPAFRPQRRYLVDALPDCITSCRAVMA